jgi:hypothetical protein
MVHAASFSVVTSLQSISPRYCTRADYSRSPQSNRLVIGSSPMAEEPDVHPVKFERRRESFSKELHLKEDYQSHVARLRQGMLQYSTVSAYQDASFPSCVNAYMSTRK